MPKGVIIIKNPNGFGSVYKLSGRRRKPYAIMISNGYDENGKRLRQIIGYAKTKAEGLQILAAYNDCPYDVETSKQTFAEIYKLWEADKFTADSNRNTKKNYLIAFNHCKDIHDMPMCDIRPVNIQNVVDELTSHDSATRCLNLISQMYDFCIRNEILKKNYADAVKINQKKPPKKAKNIFTEEEINRLWEHSQGIEEQYILIQIYSGMRVGEMLALTKADVNLEEHYLNIREAKTENGVRKVPIHDRIYPLIQECLARSKCDALIISIKGKPMSYDNYKRNYFHPCCEKHDMTHESHECRHTFISRATIAGCNPIYIRKIVGHTSLMTLAERTYTHIDIPILLADINKVA